jgi:tetratricopeptide (TPR) repeat protein
MSMRRVAIAAAVVWSASVAAQPASDAIVQLAQSGWDAARTAAGRGGSAADLVPAVRLLAELDAMVAESRWPLQGSYARSLVAAAIAAAQDERGEMEVHLTHARDLSARLESSAYPAEWPMPIDEAAGELWFEVDEYAEALQAFQRAVARKPAAQSWLGLARSAARLRDLPRACDGYRQVLQWSSVATQLQEAREYITRCR